MSRVPLGVGPGTTVSGKIGIVPSPIPSLAYGRLTALAPQSRLFPLPGGGFGKLESTYQYQEEAWLKFADGRQIDLIVHSQNALHGARFAIRHPDLVRKAILVNGPFHGAIVAGYVSRFVPCAKDMTPVSRVLPGWREEIEATVNGWARTGQTDVPELHFFGLKHDLIVPSSSPYMQLEGDNVFNHCVGRAPCPPKAPWQRWHPIKRGPEPNHFNVLWLDSTVKLVDRWLNQKQRLRLVAVPEAA